MKLLSWTEIILPVWCSDRKVENTIEFNQMGIRCSLSFFRKAVKELRSEAIFINHWSRNTIVSDFGFVINIMDALKMQNIIDGWFIEIKRNHLAKLSLYR